MPKSVVLQLSFLQIIMRIVNPPTGIKCIKNDTSDELAENLAQEIIRVATECVQTKKSFFFAVSGGSMAKQLEKLPGWYVMRNGDSEW